MLLRDVQAKTWMVGNSSNLAFTAKTKIFEWGMEHLFFIICHPYIPVNFELISFVTCILYIERNYLTRWAHFAHQ